MSNQFILGLTAAIFVGGICAYLGSLMVTKRMALVGDALGHVALPGMGLALIFGFDVSLGAFIFLLLGVIMIWALGLKTSLPMEALVGVIFVASLAAGFLIIPEPELLESLIGDITEVSLRGALAAAVLSAAVFFVVRKIYPALILSNISEDMARAEGAKMTKYNLIYLLSVAAVVALGIKITGTLLVGALVIAPAATARNLSRNLKQYSAGSAAVGILSVVAGIFVALGAGLPPGPAIVLVNIALFIFSLFWRHLWRGKAGADN